MFTLQPTTFSVPNGKTLQFHATDGKTNAPAQVKWSVSPSSGAGTISPTGLYTAPATGNGTVSVAATSNTDPTQQVTASGSYGG